MPEITLHQIVSVDEKGDLKVKEELNAMIRVETYDDVDRKSRNHHRYNLYGKQPDNSWTQFLEIRFQKGPYRIVDAEGVEIGKRINGCTLESLIGVCEDHLERHQTGPAPCQENQRALDALREAMAALKSRTQSRLDRGVEGTDKP